MARYATAQPVEVRLPLYPICELTLLEASANTEVRTPDGRVWVLTDPGAPGVVYDEVWTVDGLPVTGCSRGPTLTPALTPFLDIRANGAVWILERREVRQLWRRGSWPRAEPVVIARPTRCL